MRSTLMLVTANLRKNKSRTLTMLLIILISIMLLNIGLVLYFRTSDFFDLRAEALNAPHWTSFRIPEEFIPARYEFIRGLPYTADTELQTFIMASGSMITRGVTHTGTILIAPYCETQRMNPPQARTPLADNSILVPYSMAFGGQITPGDDVQIIFQGEELSFTFAGATDEIMFDGGLGGTRRFYVSAERFEYLRGRFPDAVFAMIAVRLENTGDISRLSSAVWNEFIDESYLTLTNLSGPRMARTTVPLIAAMLIAAFSLIVLTVGVIVIRFRITNDIDEGMVNIGVQKATGYRNRQIVLSVALQFTCIALAGGLLGILAAQAALPFVIGLIQPILGLPWNPSFDIPLMAASLAAVLLTVILFSYISARRINKLHPLTALRGGISTHSFKRNPFPLDKSRGPLVLLLALKSLFTNKKQAIMISLIIVAVSFTSVAGIAAHYNINVNRYAFLRTIVGEIPDIIFTLDDPDYVQGFRYDMIARPEVERVSSGGFTGMATSLFVAGRTITFTIVDDFAYLSGYELVSGRFPRHDNEIAIGATTLESMGLNIGDMVEVTGHDGEITEPFIVTGSTQSLNHSGMVSVAALERVGVFVQLSTVNTHLIAGADIDTFIESVLYEHSGIILNVLHMGDVLDNQLGGMNDIFSAVTAVILAVVTAVVVLVLFLVIKTTIIRKRRELGIQKALGYTNLQLMNQIALGMIPSILFGAVIGAAGGYLGFDAIFVALLSGQGIARANLPVPLTWTVGMCAALILLAYSVSMFVAWRIRKISAYTLVTE